jgi:signal transduction histidine kinase
MEAQRSQRRELAQANRRLMRYASTIEQLSVTRERNRLAQEMHDTLAHTLSALAVELDALSSVWSPEASRARRILEHALTTTRDGLDETRRALQAMRASPLEDLGLARAVRTLARNTAERCGLQLTLRGPADFGDLPPEIEHTYYRVAQEALENVVRHAEAETLFVGLMWEGHHLVLTVRDDGIGLPEPIYRDTSHFGLRGMRERADFIGGALTIASEADGGTTIILRTEVLNAWRDL